MNLFPTKITTIFGWCQLKPIYIFIKHSFLGCRFSTNKQVRMAFIHWQRTYQHFRKRYIKKFTGMIIIFNVNKHKWMFFFSQENSQIFKWIRMKISNSGKNLCIQNFCNLKTKKKTCKNFLLPAFPIENSNNFALVFFFNWKAQKLHIEHWFTMKLKTKRRKKNQWWW